MSAAAAMVRTIVPLAVASVVFALLWPLTCTGGADGAADPRMFCETFWRWKLPWSRIDGPVGVIAMLVLPLVAAVAAFLLLRATVRPDDGT